MAKSQNGYTVLDSLADCRYYEIAGTYGVRIPLRKNIVGWVLAHFAKEFNDKVENLNKTDTHGYNRRQISGSSYWSNHASGTAVDLNATKHAYGRVNTFNSTQLTALRELLSKYDSTIKWGGDYRNTKDEMHFEIDKPFADVQLVGQILRRNNKISLKRVNAIGRRNIDVYLVKKALIDRGYNPGALNKYFGKPLQRAYSEWQESLGYSGTGADGIPGRVSLEALGFTVVN